jgi:hypothetical protein
LWFNRSDTEFKLVKSTILRKRLIDEEMQHCTFSPQLVASKSWARAKQTSARQREQAQYVNQHLHAHHHHHSKGGAGNQNHPAQENPVSSVALNMAASSKAHQSSAHRHQPHGFGYGPESQEEPVNNSPSKSIMSLRESIKKFNGATAPPKSSSQQPKPGNASAAGSNNNANVTVIPVQLYSSASKSYFEQGV